MFWIGVIVIICVGTLLHFLYEKSHHNKFVAIFAAVNESTWEHIKIGMTATILWSLYDGWKYGLNSNYLIAKAMCLLTIILLIPALFYIYTAFTKKAILVVDIISFCIVIYVSQVISYYFMNLEALPFIYTYLSAILLLIEIGMYMFLTFNPMKNFIFKDPINHKYGLAGHTHHHHHNHEEHDHHDHE